MDPVGAVAGVTSALMMFVTFRPVGDATNSVSVARAVATSITCATVAWLKGADGH